MFSIYLRGVFQKNTFFVTVCSQQMALKHTRPFVHTVDYVKIYYRWHIYITKGYKTARMENYLLKWRREIRPLVS